VVHSRKGREASVGLGSLATVVLASLLSGGFHMKHDSPRGKFRCNNAATNLLSNEDRTNHLLCFRHRCRHRPAAGGVELCLGVSEPRGALHRLRQLQGRPQHNYCLQVGSGEPIWGKLQLRQQLWIGRTPHVRRTLQVRRRRTIRRARCVRRRTWVEAIAPSALRYCPPPPSPAPRERVMQSRRPRSPTYLSAAPASA
jgi:hypothetical protein